jgi:hypothetical protein
LEFGIEVTWFAGHKVFSRLTCTQPNKPEQLVPSLPQ